MRVRIMLEIGGTEYEHTREIEDTYGNLASTDSAGALLDGVVSTIKRAAGIKPTEVDA